MSDPTNPYKAPASTEAASPSVTGGAGVTAKTRDYLGQAAPWLRFLTVLGYIGIVLIVLVGVAMTFMGGLLGNLAGGLAMIGPILGLVYVGLAVLFYFPVRILGKMAKSAKKYKLQGDAADLEGVAGAVHGLAKFYGIVAIVFIALYVLIIIGAAIFGVMAAGQLSS
jgi:hypothetical protein